MTYSVRVEFLDKNVEVAEGLTRAEAEFEYPTADRTGLVYSVTVLCNGKPAYGWVQKGQSS